MSRLRGARLCGAVRYEIDGAVDAKAAWDEIAGALPQLLGGLG